MTTADVEELPILIIRFFAESTLPHEIDCCHMKNRCLFDRQMKEINI